MYSKNEQNYYELLEVAPTAAPHEIHIAFQRAKKTYSPDSPALYTMFTEHEAKELLALIEEAYGVLSSQSRRDAYDRSLAQKSATSSAQLPDFPAPTSAKVTNISEAKSRDGSLPPGHARTRFGTFPIQADVEEEIRTSTSADGQFLKKVRTYKKISLEQLSGETRISKTYLTALENNDYEALPAAVFVRGFVVQVARALGVPEQQAASAYMEHFKKGRRE